MIETSGTIDYAFDEQFPGNYVRMVEEGKQIITLVSDNGCNLRLEILSPQIIRFRYAVDGFFHKDFSYAIDPGFKKEAVPYEVKEQMDVILVSTPLLNITIDKTHLYVKLFNKQGVLISADEKGFHWVSNDIQGGEVVKMSKQAFHNEAFYGLGDKTSTQNIKGYRFTNWGTDEFGYRMGSDPLYKNINLHYSFRDGLAHGIFFDNSFRSHYDVCHLRQEVLSFWAEGGEMNYYFLFGEDLLQVASSYAKLTGVPELPPKWTLGYQQSKWSYYPESRVKEVAERLRKEGIPCDAIYLDIDYMDGFRCFTWDEERFPEPKKMVKDLKENGFKTVAIIDPGIKIDPEYKVFQAALENDFFCKRSDGPFMKGKVWPGECYFPDFTNPKVRSWWASLFEDLIGDIGLDGIWTDMNEPAVFEVPSKTFPDDVRHDYDGNPCSHRKAHNVYGMQMARATAAGFKQHSNDKRPLIITRSGYSGFQRYSSTWTGDNLANWEHLMLAHLQTLRLSISGVSFCGSDVGGFIDQPSGELFLRWIQLGIFHPFFRNHSSGDHGDQEPWVFGEDFTELIREAIELRYQLLPYIYTCFYEHTKTREPILRPLMFVNSTEKPYLLNNISSGYLGANILYSPVVQKGQREKNIFLPEGVWYDFQSLEKFSGNRTITIETPLSKIPFFAQAGSVIPLYPIQQYVGQQQIDIVTLRVFYSKARNISTYYEDGGDGYAYQEGNFRYTTFETDGNLSNFNLYQSWSGKFKPSFSKYRLQFIGLSAANLFIKVDGQIMEYYQLINDNIVELVVQRDFTNVEIQF